MCDLPPHDDRAYLKSLPKPELVTVADADRYSAGNGHGHLGDSPWVSNNLLIKWRQSLSPGARGLFRPHGDVVWRSAGNHSSKARSSGGAIVPRKETNMWLSPNMTIALLVVIWLATVYLAFLVARKEKGQA